MPDSLPTADGASRPSALYLLTGLRLLGQPGIRRFVAVPLAINIAIFGLVGWAITGTVIGWLSPETATAPTGWFSTAFAWVRHVAAILASIFVWLALAWVYTLVANIIGAPFNGLLAERVEAHLTGRTPPPGSSFSVLLREIPRTLSSEVAKIWYLVSRFIPLVLVATFVPIVNLAGPLLLFLFGAWVFALEYLDYPMGNHGARFRDVKRQVGERRMTALGFGMSVTAVSAIPLLNLIVMPAAVAGATALWVDRWDKR